MTSLKAPKELLRRFMADESGLSAVEYGLLAAGIAIGLWTFLQGIGTDLGSIFGKVKTDLDSAKTGSGT